MSHPTRTTEELAPNLAAEVSADWQEADIPWASPWTWVLALAATAAGALLPLGAWW